MPQLPFARLYIPPIPSCCPRSRGTQLGVRPGPSPRVSDEELVGLIRRTSANRTPRLINARIESFGCLRNAVSDAARGRGDVVSDPFSECRSPHTLDQKVLIGAPVDRQDVVVDEQDGGGPIR